MPIDSPKSEDEKLLDKLIAEKFSLMNQEIKEKRKFCTLTFKFKFFNFSI